MTDAEGPIRLTDVLTTASAVADFLGEREVTAGHLLEAIAILTGEKGMEDLGRPVSPFIPRPPGGRTIASPAVRALAQHWYEALGSDPTATLSPGHLARLRLDCQALTTNP